MNYVCILFAISGVTQGLPGKYGMYYPKRSMMFGSYYSNPMETGYEYVPQGQMTAMVSGDTVATNSFSGQRWKAPPAVVPNLSAEEVFDSHPAVEQMTEKQQPSFSGNEADAEFDFEADNKSKEADAGSSSETAEFIPTTEAQIFSSTKAPKVQPSKKVSPKRKSKKPVKQEEEKAKEYEDEDENEAPVWPFGATNSRKASGFPGYNTFFPIFIGGSGSSRSRTRSGSLEDPAESMVPSGSATAIANSFSTGKGGVATSHATSFGDPMAAAFFKNSGLFGDYEGFMRRNKKPISELRD